MQVKHYSMYKASVELQNNNIFKERKKNKFWIKYKFIEK